MNNKEITYIDLNDYKSKKTEENKEECLAKC